MILKFVGGDGDQRYFAESFLVEKVEENWFPAKLKRGPAWLVKILDGSHRGEYLALTSRVIASLEEQLAVRNMLSVVVQTIRNPGFDLTETEISMPAIGMAAIEVIKK